MSGQDATQPRTALGSALFLAQLTPNLEPLRPLLRIWAREASQRFREARDWTWAHQPWGIGALHDIAHDLGWAVEHGRLPALSGEPGQPWPLGWLRSVEFSLSPPGSSARWAFAVRRLFVPAWTAIDDSACATALRSALRSLRRLPFGQNDVGVAVVELRIPIPVGTGHEAADLEQAIERLHQVRRRLGADGLLLHAVPTGAKDDAYGVRVMAALLAIL